MASKSMYSSQSKSLESNTLLSVEEIEEKIQQLITENTDLRSVLFLYFFIFKFFFGFLTFFMLYTRYIATEQHIHETAFFDIGGMAGGGYKSAKCLSKQS